MRCRSRAGVPVRDVLVADASRRTRKYNAYVSGIGSTRRVVLFDTLLARCRAKPELEIVVAHELGHRRHRDVAKGTVLATLSAAVAVLVAWPLDPTPRRIPVLLFVWGLLELVSLPFTAAFSRRLERRADRFALDLTHDVGGVRVGVSPDGEARICRPRSAAARLHVHLHAPDSGGTHRRRESA